MCSISSSLVALRLVALVDRVGSRLHPVALTLFFKSPEKDGHGGHGDSLEFSNLCVFIELVRGYTTETHGPRHPTYPTHTHTTVPQHTHYHTPFTP